MVENNEILQKISITIQWVSSLQVDKHVHSYDAAESVIFWVVFAVPVLPVNSKLLQRQAGVWCRTNRDLWRSV